MSKRAVIYARVSYDDRPNDDRNLESQIEDSQAYCRERGYRIVAELAEDDRGASGASWELPMLNQALDMARVGEYDVLVTRELDRFARGLAKQLVVESEFKRRGVEVEYIEGEYPDTPEGQLNKNIRAVIAEFEREKIAQRMTRGRRNVVKSGKVMLHGNKPPYGYRVENRMLVIYEPEAKIVRLIFTWYVYGDENDKRLASRAIAERLTAMKVPTWADTHNSRLKSKRKYGEWSWRQVINILTTETYKGMWYYGRRNCWTGEENPPEYWLSLEVPAIVEPDLWEKAQAQRKKNTTLAKRNVKREYLVARRVKCGACNSGMCGYSTVVRGKLYLYYRCNAVMGGVAHIDCKLPSFRVDQVDAAVWEKVKEWLQDAEVLEKSLEKVKAKLEQKNQPLLDHLAMVDDLLAENRRELEKLLDLYLSTNIKKEMFIDRQKRYETTIESLEKERADLMMTLESQALMDEQIKTIIDFAKKVASGLEGAEKDFETRRRIIDSLDVQVRLVVEDGLKVAYVRWVVSGEEKRLSIENITSQSGAPASDRPPSSDGIRPPVDRTSPHRPSLPESGTPSAVPWSCP